jgi:hypothetical protein
MSALPPASVATYQTADRRIAWHFAKHDAVPVNGSNLLQPYHYEFAGDAASR